MRHTFTVCTHCQQLVISIEYSITDWESLAAIEDGDNGDTSPRKKTCKIAELLQMKEL